MLTSVLSIVRGPGTGGARARMPALELNAYAVAEDVELTLLLEGRALELAVARAVRGDLQLSGVTIARTAPNDEIRALLASGVRVVGIAEDAADRGLAPEDLVQGVELISSKALGNLIASHEKTLTTANS